MEAETRPGEVEGDHCGKELSETGVLDGVERDTVHEGILTRN